MLAIAIASVTAVANPEFVDVHETGVGLKLVSHALNHDVFAVTVKVLL